MKSILTLAVVAAALSTPVFATTVVAPDGGATALLSVISMGALFITSKLIKK